MGQDRFQNLDEEGKALHGSWIDVGRVFLVVLLSSALIWALCAGLKTLIHFTQEHLFALVEHHGLWWGSLLLVGVLVAGGVLRGLLNRWASWQEVASDGVDVALSNFRITYERDGDDPAPRYERATFGTALRKVIATFLTLGTGASGGLEGPVVLVGEAMGAGFSRLVRVRSEHELRTYQIAGISAAVGTLLNAPFTAALFAIEIAYGDRVIYRKVAYALLAANVAYVLNNHVLGYTPIFITAPHERIYSLLEYGATALVAVAVSAPLALSFGLIMKHLRAVAKRARPLVRGAVASLGAGLVAVILWASVGMNVAHVLGMGDWTLKLLLLDSPPAELSLWWFLLLAILGKLLTTGFTVQSGGSAGLLIPSMFLGGVSGATTYLLLHKISVFPSLDPAIFVVVGIASALVAMVGVPLAAIALVLEVFGSSYGPPAALACGLTYVITLRLSVYDTDKDNEREAARKAQEAATTAPEAPPRAPD